MFILFASILSRLFPFPAGMLSSPRSPACDSRTPSSTFPSTWLSTRTDYSSNHRGWYGADVRFRQCRRNDDLDELTSKWLIFLFLRYSVGAFWSRAISCDKKKLLSTFVVAGTCIWHGKEILLIILPWVSTAVTKLFLIQILRGPGLVLHVPKPASLFKLVRRIDRSILVQLPHETSCETVKAIVHLLKHYLAIDTIPYLLTILVKSC